MKTLLSFFLIILSSSLTNAQTTAIPDTTFEQTLIYLGYDTGTPDGIIPTANIDTIEQLYLSTHNIYDLTGIEAFSALTLLNCNNNHLNYINLSQNIALEYLDCGINPLDSLDLTNNSSLLSLTCYANQLTELDVSQNTALSTIRCSNNNLTQLDLIQNISLFELKCNDNQLTSLDVTQNVSLTRLECDHNQIANINLSQNILLSELWCGFNPITNLDVSQNLALYRLHCYSCLLTSLDLSQNIVLNNLHCRNNQLNCLNIKNGNNTNINLLWADNNPSLTCIEVDAGWTPTVMTTVDANVSFNSNCNNFCSTVGIEEQNLNSISIYPNPTTGHINIDLEENNSNVNLHLTNAIGQFIRSKNYKSNSHITFDLDAPSGVYFLRLESNGEVITKKIIKE
jgi:hypothetical protein